MPSTTRASTPGYAPPARPVTVRPGDARSIPVLGVLLLAILAPAAIGLIAVTAGPAPAVVMVVAVVVVVVVARTAHDAVTVLELFAILLLLFPSYLVFSPLQGVGAPATLFGVGTLWLWAHGKLLPSFGLARGLQPVRIVVLAWAFVNVASYVVAFSRPLDGLEARAADRGLVVTASATGIALLAADGIRTRERLEALLRALGLIGGALAGIGIIQFLLGIDLAAMVRLPGLELNDPALSRISERWGYRRVSGTTAHAIEFCVVLSMLLPFAIHYAVAGGRRHRLLHWASVALMAAAIPMAVSRSGALGALVVGLVLVPTWPARWIRRAVALGAVYVVAMKLAVPGLLGTIRSLFLNAGIDPSVLDRQSDYGYVARFVRERPIFGRGFSTFLPTRYDYLDNQYLGTLVETGVVGLVALVALFVVAMGLAVGARRRSDDFATRHLAQALLASIAAAAVTSATFDFLGFPTSQGVAFLVIGASGALWRLQAGADAEAPWARPARSAAMRRA